MRSVSRHWVVRSGNLRTIIEKIIRCSNELENCGRTEHNLLTGLEYSTGLYKVKLVCMYENVVVRSSGEPDNTKLLSLIPCPLSI
jgi:hypothetical protein